MNYSNHKKQKDVKKHQSRQSWKIQKNKKHKLINRKYNKKTFKILNK